MEIKVMVVPGKIAKLDVPTGTSVLGACSAASRSIPGVDWVGLAKSREVRVQNRKFSNTEEVPAGYAGTIYSTPLMDGDVVLVLTKIEGNECTCGHCRRKAGLGVLTCKVNGAEYALETPDQVGKVLANVVGIDTSKVAKITINGRNAEPTQLVGNGDDIVVKMAADTAGMITVKINGKKVVGTPADIRSILFAG